MPSRRLKRWVLRPLVVGLVAFGAFAGWMLGFWDNFGVVVPGELYRSAQLSGRAVASKVREHRVRTVLNLRGSHPESAWYRAERTATLEGGATQIDIPLSSCEWMSRAQAKTLLEVLETAERPILIHCFHGSERTGMVAAFAILLRQGATLAEARAQFTPTHLYFGLGDGVVTHQHLDAYEEWLRGQALEHSPSHFRRWLGGEYRPSGPNREQWDHDPYPLLVVTKAVKRLADRR